MDVTYIIERRRAMERRARRAGLVHFLENSERRDTRDRRSRGQHSAKKVIPVCDFDGLLIELEQIPCIDRYEVFATVDDKGHIFKVSISTANKARATSPYDVKRVCPW